MKKFFFVLLMSFFSFQGSAQEPDLFQTWYLTDYYYDFGEEYDVIDINPPINPTLTIEENLEFSGTGACNEFFGSFTYDNGALIVTDFIPTLVICDHSEHIDFEQQYFGYFYPGSLYSMGIYTDTDLQILALDGPLFNGMNFSNQSLLTSDFTTNNITIYPNPVSKHLFISSEDIVIEKISIYSLTGRKVVEVVNENNSIDVSTLSKGMYFVEIFSSKGKTVKKFIKK